uniref:Cytochrome c oxidase subunit 5B, mitochondrial n=1 Tax=Pseudonaja textilis TaxID=8673 RepID=A0A670XSB9_PSETE
MVSSLLQISGALQALWVGPTLQGMVTDEEQATGIERKVLDAIKKGVDPYGVHPSKLCGGTKDDPHFVPSLTNVRLMGCICNEDAMETYYIWLHKDKMERCPSCGPISNWFLPAHYGCRW